MRSPTFLKTFLASAVSLGRSLSAHTITGAARWRSWRRRRWRWFSCRGRRRHHGGGYSGGAMHGGSYGGYHGGSGGYAGRGTEGSHGVMGSASRENGGSHPWASEGHGVRNTSPGFHSFERGSNGAASGMRSGMAERSGSMAGSHTAIADGNWHSFAGERPASAMASTTRFGPVASFNRGFLGPVAPGFRGGFGFGGFGFRGGFGCWGCGFGWGWGLGWGWDGVGALVGWGPGWAYAPYWGLVAVLVQPLLVLR